MQASAQLTLTFLLYDTNRADGLGKEILVAESAVAPVTYWLNGEMAEKERTFRLVQNLQSRPVLNQMRRSDPVLFTYASSRRFTTSKSAITSFMCT